MALNYVTTLNGRKPTIIFNNKYIECKCLNKAELLYHKLLKENKDAKIAMVYHNLIYNANYNPKGFKK